MHPWDQASGGCVRGVCKHAHKTKNSLTLSRPQKPKMCERASDKRSSWNTAHKWPYVTRRRVGEWCRICMEDAWVRECRCTCIEGALHRTWCDICPCSGARSVCVSSKPAHKHCDQQNQPDFLLCSYLSTRDPPATIAIAAEGFDGHWLNS